MGISNLIPKPTIPNSQQGSDPGGYYIDPWTGRSVDPSAGYGVYVPPGSTIRVGPNGQYEVVEGNLDDWKERIRLRGDAVAAQAAAAKRPLNPDPFDLKIREAALNDLLLKRRATTRQSTFTTGPYGIQGPAKTVLG